MRAFPRLGDYVIATRLTSSPAGFSKALLVGARMFGAMLDRHALLIYGTLLALVVAVCQLALQSFSVETDEAWILLSTFKAFRLGMGGAEAVEFPTVTSGGLHLLIHGLLGHATDAIAVHRTVSLLFLAILLLLVFALMRRLGAPPKHAAAGAMLVLATPGLLLQASLAMAEIIATVVLLATVVYWERRGRLSLSGSAITGLLLGLTCATRTNCLVSIPVMAVCATLDAADWTTGLSRAATMVAGSVVVYGIGVGGYAGLFVVGNWAGFAHAMGGATGASVDKNLGDYLLNLNLAADFFPPLLIAGVLAGLVAIWRRGAGELRLPLVLVSISLVGALAWIIEAPIPHVRYAWPFAPFLFVAGGILAHLTGALARPWSQPVVHLFVIGSVLHQTVTSLVYIGAGDSLVAVSQANRQVGVPSPLEHTTNIRQQQNMARFIAGLPGQANITTEFYGTGYPLSYLSQRPIRGITSWDSPRLRPLYFVIAPVDIALPRQHSRVIGWLQRNCTLALRAGDYSIFSVHGPEPFPVLVEVHQAD